MRVEQTGLDKPFLDFTMQISMPELTKPISKEHETYRTIGLYEPYCSGHRMHYVRWITTELVKTPDVNVILFTEEDSLRHPTVQVLRDSCGDSLKIVSIKPLPEPRQISRVLSNKLIEKVKSEINEFRRIRGIMKSIQAQNKIDFLFIPYLDYLFHVCGIASNPFGRLKWGGIALRPRFHMNSTGIRSPRRWFSIMEKHLFFRLVKSTSLRKVFLIDPFLVEYLKPFNRENHKVIYLPDPVEEAGTECRETIRRDNKIPEDQVIILVFGSLDNRKGIDILLNAMNHTAVPQSLGIFLAGVHSSEIKGLLSTEIAQSLQNSGRLVSWDEYLSNADAERAFKMSDIVWLGYRDHYGSSGVQIQASLYELPVIATHEGLIGRLTNLHRSGETVEIENLNSVRGVLNGLCKDKHRRKEFGKNAFSAFSAHTAENFGTTVAQGILEEVEVAD